MIVRTRFGLVIATTALAALALFSTAACSGTPAAAAAAALSPEQSALTALGFSTDDVSTTGVTPTTNASAGPGKTGTAKHPRLRRLAIKRLALRGHVEHGQVTVQTKTGDQTIDVQRGTVTAITSTTMTVKSTDGYTLTWTTSGPLTVIEHRTAVQPGAIAVGDLVGVAGTQTGATANAKLIVVPNKTPAATTGS
jgi:hypothetical protein